MERGKFIVLEGIDGSGTTTQAALLVNYLFKKEGKHVFLTREPTGFAVGKKIKESLKDDKAAGIDPLKEKGEEYARRYIEDRKWHLSEAVMPNLEKGVDVISDRHKYSTLAYQKAQGMNFEELARRHEGLLLPDLVIIIDLPVEEAMSRRLGDESVPEFFEKVEFQKKARENYLSLKEKLEGEKIVIVDGSGSIEEVHQEIVKEVEKLFGVC